MELKGLIEKFLSDLCDHTLEENDIKKRFLGFNFAPSHEEIFSLLEMKNAGKELPHDFVEYKAIYSTEPWNLFNKDKKENFVFTQLTHLSKFKIKRTVGCSTWDADNKIMKDGDDCDGVKLFRKSFGFSCPENGKWRMQEFSLQDYSKIENFDGYVLCKINYRGDSDINHAKKNHAHKNHAHQQVPADTQRKRKIMHHENPTDPTFGGLVPIIELPTETSDPQTQNLEYNFDSTPRDEDHMPQIGNLHDAWRMKRSCTNGTIEENAEQSNSSAVLTNGNSASSFEEIHYPMTVGYLPDENNYVNFLDGNNLNQGNGVIQRNLNTEEENQIAEHTTYDDSEDLLLVDSWLDLNDPEFEATFGELNPNAVMAHGNLNPSTSLNEDFDVLHTDGMPGVSNDSCNPHALGTLDDVPDLDCDNYLSYYLNDDDHMPDWDEICK